MKCFGSSKWCPTLHDIYISGDKLENRLARSLSCCSEIYLYLDNSDIADLKKGDKYEYILMDSNGNQYKYIEIIKIEPTGKWILIEKHDYDFSQFSLGESEITCRLDYSKLPGIETLYSLEYSAIPTFHETYIEILYKDSKAAHFQFKGGFHPFITDLFCDDIFEEQIQMDDSGNPLEYFIIDGNVGSVEFITLKEGFEIIISNNFVYNYIRLTEECKEEHINEYHIFCNQLKLNFNKNPDIDCD
jgi:hypothetical protein